jgi:hypothetical protein
MVNMGFWIAVDVMTRVRIRGMRLLPLEHLPGDTAIPPYGLAVK